MNWAARASLSDPRSGLRSVHHFAGNYWWPKRRSNSRSGHCNGCSCSGRPVVGQSVIAPAVAVDRVRAGFSPLDGAIEVRIDPGTDGVLLAERVGLGFGRGRCDGVDRVHRFVRWACHCGRTCLCRRRASRFPADRPPSLADHTHGVGRSGWRLSCPCRGVRDLPPTAFALVRADVVSRARASDSGGIMRLGPGCVADKAPRFGGEDAASVLVTAWAHVRGSPWLPSHEGRNAGLRRGKHLRTERGDLGRALQAARPGLPAQKRYSLSSPRRFRRLP
jgi:hypothetical protein